MKAQVPFTLVPNEVLEDSSLISSAKCLYLLILKHTGQNEIAWPSRKKLAKQLGLKSEKQITNLAHILRDRSLILIEKPTEYCSTNTYIPLVTIEGKVTSRYTGKLFRSYGGNRFPLKSIQEKKNIKKGEICSVGEIIKQRIE